MAEIALNPDLPTLALVQETTLVTTARMILALGHLA